MTKLNEIGSELPGAAEVEPPATFASVTAGGSIVTTAPNEDVVRYMVGRFLRWPLPADFAPDGGITAERPDYAPEMEWRPVGTNLLTAAQAEAMIRHLLDGLPNWEAAATAYADVALGNAARIGELEIELARALATPPASDAAVPAGFVLVPAEPTETMLIAGGQCSHDPELWEDSGRLTQATWSAMLAAAPKVASAYGKGMGVTGNAILLLGYAGGCLHGAPDPFYAVEEADPRAGTLQVRRHGTDNIYRISVVQLEGIE